MSWICTRLRAIQLNLPKPKQKPVTMSPSVALLFPDEVRAKLVSQMHMDPQIPQNDPTVATWQLPPHSLSEIQSDHLSPTTDMAIIGSGVTGCSVSSNLLENPRLGDGTVTVFEARTLTSGATSRNAGFLLSHIPKYFKEMVEGYGEERAIAIARLCNRTREKMSKLATLEGPEVEKASEKRGVQAILAYEEEEALEACLESVQLYEEMFPEAKGLYSRITRETAEKVRLNIYVPFPWVLTVEPGLSTSRHCRSLIHTSRGILALPSDHQSVRVSPAPLQGSFFDRDQDSSDLDYLLARNQCQASVYSFYTSRQRPSGTSLPLL